ncbi:MAG: D-alanine--D-alanine ligase family protein [Actinomycetota bacterium]|nr:D-alanine--D-alanine ligase family protein [Actinomycetota bacterium]
MSRVLMLFGGRSAEHEVSCTSALAIYDALLEGGHRVIPVGIDRSGEWWVVDSVRRPFRAEGRRAALRLPDGRLLAGDDDVGYDVVFPVLHGPFGEDGTIQGVFEIAGKPYVGCGVLPSALAMDKDIAKQIFEAADIPTSRWRVVRGSSYRSDPAAAVASLVKRLGLPVFVKPAELGSSVGISKVDQKEALRDAIDGALRYGDKVIVEEFISGREIEVAVLEGPRTALPGEVHPAGDWYDYDSKYEDEQSDFEVPARLSERHVADVRALAARAFEAIEGRGLARVDFFLEENGRGFLINEVNTMPGFTPISGFPKMWTGTEMTYAELCNELVEIALAN